MKSLLFAPSERPGPSPVAFLLVLIVSVITLRAAPVAPTNHEVVVYGGTAAGVTAAIGAARQGASVVLIEPGRHIGGMTSGGLGATDIGKDETIGGLSREFYRRIKAYYARPSAWREEKREDFSSRRYDLESDVMYRFEPHVAELVLNEMLREAGVEVVMEERLELKNGVVKEGTCVREIIMESGRRFTGRVFIDTSYEGDLMAKAGVSYRVGREANAEYGETQNGNQPWSMHGGKVPRKPDLNRAVDPYVRPGDPSSGLLFGVHEAGPGEVGVGDHRIQGYCYRICLTKVPENRVPFPKPEGYDPARYELVLRHLTSERPLLEFEGPMPEVEHPVLGNNLMTTPPLVIMPNHKSDSNNKGGISFDYLGGNYDYPDGDYATRDRVTRDHINWQQGLIWFVANDPRVPASYREPMKEWGLAKDEFVDTGHWPHQLYVREGRRMVGEYVMREQDCLGQEVPPDSVGLGSYALDSHSVRRYIDANGNVRNEGKVIAPRVSEPYPIGYGAITPKKSQCTNLLVPVCLSATHIAYGSIRMEPVYMILGESAGVAAVRAIQENRAVQDIDRGRFRAILLGNGQILDPGDSAVDGVLVKAESTGKHPARPNIVLCMTDDQGWGDVAYNGNAVLRTPNLDRMAASGVRFDRFYAAHFNCSPTRASVMTGRHPARFRCYSWGHDLPLAETTIAELAARAGYSTGHFGKWHLGGIPNADGGSGRGLPESLDAAPRHPGNQGFDEWLSAGNWFDLNPPAGVFYHNGEPLGERVGDTSDIVMDDALRFIRRQAEADRPFLCVIWFPSPHSPFRASDSDRAPYSDRSDDADFLGEMAEVDRAMGRLREELGQLGVRENTLLWFNSDNGSDGGTAGPLAGMKGSLWEGGLRVPGIIEWAARVREPRHTDATVSTVDILPTICEVMGVPLPGGQVLDGRSVLPILDGTAAGREAPLGFASCDVRTGEFNGSALVDGDWKLLRLTRPARRDRNQPGEVVRPGEYLFNLKSDPAEQRDLRKEQPEIFARLRRELNDFEASVALSAAAYPLVPSLTPLRPVMLKSVKEIANLVVDRLAFPAPGWSERGQGQRDYADGGLRLRAAGIGRELTHANVILEFRFRLDEAGRVEVALGAAQLPVCRAEIDATGITLFGRDEAGRRVELARSSRVITAGEWHEVVAETHEREVLLQIDGREGALWASLPQPMAAGFALEGAAGTVWLKDVFVSVGEVVEGWESARAKLLHEAGEA